MPSFYAIARGRVCGVYSDWTMAKEQIVDFVGARFRKFSTETEAREFIESFEHAKRIEGRPPRPSPSSALTRVETKMVFKEDMIRSSVAPGPSAKQASIMSYFGSSLGQTAEVAQPKALARTPSLFLPTTLPTEGYDEQMIDTVLETYESCDKDLTVFTDGSALHNGRANAMAGFAVVFPDYENHNTALRLMSHEKQTNNTAEYRAVIEAFRIADAIDPYRVRRLVVYTDSQLLVNSLTKWMAGWKRNGWITKEGKPVSNKNLLDILDRCMKERGHRFVHVKAHTGGSSWEAQWNDKVDKMARGTLRSE